MSHFGLQLCGQLNVVARILSHEIRSMNCMEVLAEFIKSWDVASLMLAEVN